ncbi:MAG TPA: ribokinase [Verrucomicrobiae bacterium]|nr:ribokinase [Verrucomicrobiae bacterium]
MSTRTKRTTRKPQILVVGSSNTDMIIKLARIPRPGETVLGGEFLTAAGGKGANQAVSAARAGGSVTFIARLGKDVFGDNAIERFIDDGIDVDPITRDPEEPSGAALIFVARDGENSIAVAPGANGRLSPAHLKKAKAAFANVDTLLMQLEVPLETVLEAAKIASRAKVRIILNPAPARPLPAQLLKMVSILTPNETEAEALTGIRVKGPSSISRAADHLLRRGVQGVVLTLGARGAFVAAGKLRQFVPGAKVKAVDCTAAGDVFYGALCVALSEGRPLLEAVRFANAAAAISVTRMGAQPSAPHRKEIERFMLNQLIRG